MIREKGYMSVTFAGGVIQVAIEDNMATIKMFVRDKQVAIHDLKPGVRDALRALLKVLEDDE